MGFQFTSGPVRRDHVDAILLKLVIEAVAVIRPIANEMFRLGLEHIEVVTQLDQGDFMMMGGMRTDREGQPVPIHNREDLHVFTAFGEPDGLAATFLPETAALSAAPAENFGTVRAAIFSGAPVFGFLPVRAERITGLKVPKPNSATGLPLEIAEVMMSVT